MGGTEERWMEHKWCDEMKRKMAGLDCSSENYAYMVKCICRAHDISWTRNYIVFHWLAISNIHIDLPTFIRPFVVVRIFCEHLKWKQQQQQQNQVRNVLFACCYSTYSLICADPLSIGSSFARRRWQRLMLHHNYCYWLLCVRSRSRLPSALASLPTKFNRFEYQVAGFFATTHDSGVCSPINEKKNSTTLVYDWFSLGRSVAQCIKKNAENPFFRCRSIHLCTTYTDIE